MWMKGSATHLHTMGSNSAMSKMGACDRLSQQNSVNLKIIAVIQSKKGDSKTNYNQAYNDKVKSLNTATSTRIGDECSAHSCDRSGDDGRSWAEDRFQSLYDQSYQKHTVRCAFDVTRLTT